VIILVWIQPMQDLARSIHSATLPSASLPDKKELEEYSNLTKKHY